MKVILASSEDLAALLLGLVPDGHEVGPEPLLVLPRHRAAGLGRGRREGRRPLLRAARVPRTETIPNLGLRSLFLARMKKGCLITAAEP